MVWNHFYYALYYPRGVREIMIFLLTLVICFLVIPCGIYFMIPQRVIWYLAAVYFVAVILFGGLYVVIGNKTRIRHQDTLKRGRDIRNHLRSNQKENKGYYQNHSKRMGVRIYMTLKNMTMRLPALSRSCRRLLPGKRMP